MAERPRPGKHGDAVNPGDGGLGEDGGDEAPDLIGHEDIKAPSFHGLPLLTMMLIFMSADTEGLVGTEEGQKHSVACSVVFGPGLGHQDIGPHCPVYRDINTPCTAPVKCFHAH